MLVTLPGAEKAADAALERLHAGERSVSIVGHDGAGKSSALELLRATLAKEGWRVLTVGFPRRGDDAAVVAALSLASQLSTESPDVLDCLKDLDVRWSDKQAKLTGALKSLAGAKVALTIDDPIWPRDVESTHSYFRDRAASLWAALWNVPGVRCVQASRRSFGGDEVALRVGSIPAQILSSKHWSGANAAAAKMLLSVTGLELYSPLELRLLVALVEAGLSPGELRYGRWDSRRIIDRLFGAPLMAGLKRCVASLSLVRTPFDEGLLGKLGLAQCSAEAQSLFREALLLQPAGGELRLHDLVAREAQDQGWLDALQEQQAHATLAEWHLERFNHASHHARSHDALRHELEVTHHFTEAGDARAVLDGSIYFVEQLNALGKTLSQSKRWEEAVPIYERTLEHEPNDAYAHHYLAWNLDVLARDEDEISLHYSEARRLEPSHAWYHGRRICFMITIGQLDEARAAWSEALVELDAESTDAMTPRELHRPVAQLLLHRGQLDFARDVLAHVSPRLRKELEWYPSLQLMLREQEEAEDQKIVFPPSVDFDDRWKGPHLLRDPNDRGEVTRWYAGRISAVDERGVRLRVATRLVAGVVQYGYKNLTHEELKQAARYAVDRFSLPVGTFVELLELRASANDPQREVLLTWPREYRRLPGLTDIFPRPDRFIRRATAAF